MRSLKGTGELTRGSGMPEVQRTVWTLSSPVSSAYNYAMQDFSRTLYITSDQHKELTTTRMKSDMTNLQKLAGKLEQFPPFSYEATLHNIVIGMHANEDVNMHDLFPVGYDTVKQMEGKAIFS